MTLQVQTDRTLIRAEAQSTRYVLLSFAAPESQRSTTRDPISVACVIDRLGSMGGSKIRLALDAVVQALQRDKKGRPFGGQFIEVKRRTRTFTAPLSKEQRAEIVFLKSIGAEARPVYLIER